MSVAATHSAMEEINAALQSHNPFAQPPFVNANNVWGKGFPDVETLNAHASDAVFKALDNIRAGQYSTTSILITAQNGTGKTHIISRIRHRLQAQGGALFVYANKFNDIDQIKAGFQQILADSLSNHGSQGVKQWQELAAAMANEVLSKTNPNNQIPAAKSLVKSFEKMDEEQAVQWINKLTKTFCKIKSVQDPDVVRAVFCTLIESECPYAANWLAGKALAQFKADELRLPNQNQSFDTVLQILALISEYYELVVCFDELDLLDFNSAGLHKAQLVANLVKELFENLQRGVILTVMMPGTWKERVLDQLPRGVCDKVSAHSSQPYELKYLDGDSAVELVALFLKDYYAAREIVAPHPVYPFDENQLRAIGQDKPTVREVLKWCLENCKPLETLGEVQSPTSDLDTLLDPVELAFVSELDEDISPYLDDNQFIADALLFSFQRMIGQTVERVALKDATSGVKKRKGKDLYLNFKIIGEEEGQNVVIGVAVLQYDGGGGLGAGFRRLLDEDGTFGLTRGCLVRSKTKPMKSHFKKNYLDPLINDKGGEFVDLKEEEIQPLIALRSVYQKRQSDYGVTEEQIFEFITNKGQQHLLGIHNPLLLEILSDPSYQVPTDIPDEAETVEMQSLETDSPIADSTETESFEELVIESTDE